MKRRLWVWSPPQLVGVLDETQDGFCFQYSQQWLDSDEGFAISASLKKDSRVYHREAQIFFGNLLPEGNPRSALCQKLGISVDNDFELLLRIGHDCAGALVITNEEHDSTEKSDLEEVSTAMLAAWFKNDSAGILSLQLKGGLRFSLAGAQNKLPLIYKHKRFYRPLGFQPTTHILKPNPRRFQRVPENEWIQTQVYAALGVPTVDAELVKIGENFVLVVGRYDRQQINGQWSRLHQEDFCQALAVPYQRKYETEGGPSFIDCCRLIEERSDSVVEDLDAILKWQILNVLTGNCDGHAKNLSLLRSSAGRWRLAPFYDLVATRFYPNLSHKLAMAVAGQFDSGTVLPSHWQAVFSLSRVSPAAYMELVRDIIRKLPGAVEESIDRFKNQYGECASVYAIQKYYTKLIKRNSKLILKP